MHVRPLVACALVTLAATAPAAEAVLPGTLERVTVHEAWADVVRSVSRPIRGDEMGPDGGSFIIWLGDLTPDIDAESIRVQARTPGASVLSWEVVDRPPAARERGGRGLQMVVAVANPGDHVYEVTYATRAARWRPEHRALFDEKAAQLILSTVAVVQQGTGETWDAPLFIEAGPSDGLRDPRPPAESAMRPQIPGDFSEHRVGLPDETLPARVRLVVRPSVQRHATSSVVARWSGDRALAAGPVSVLLAPGRYLGRAMLPEIPAGRELRLPLGTETRVACERSELPPRRGRASIVTRMTVSSQFDDAIAVDVEEPLGGGWEVAARTTPGWTLESGVVRWHVRLAARESRELVLRRRPVTRAHEGARRGTATPGSGGDGR